MIKIELADIYDLWRLRKIKWNYTDFAKAQVKDEYLGYGVLNVDTQVNYDVISEDDEALCVSYFEELVGMRPSMKYSYVKDFVEDKKEIEKGIYEVTFGEYPSSKITTEVDASALTKTGNKISVKQNGELVQLDELIDNNGTKMVNLNGSYYKVEKLVWLVDEAKDFMITRDVINGGFAYERPLTPEENLLATMADRIPRKLSKRNIMYAQIRNSETTLLEAFLSNVLVNEIISDEMKNKIAARDEEVAKQKAEEQAKLEAERAAKRKENAEKNRAKRQRRDFMNYAFPNDAWSAMCHLPFSEETATKVNSVIVEELENIKYYIEDKETLIEIIIHLYKAKDGKERRRPYPEERYDACRATLRQFGIEHLNIVLKNTIGRCSSYDSYVEYLCKDKNIQYIKK